MARPIEGIRPLSPKAWKWLMEYLKNHKPDPVEAEKRARERAEIAQQIRPLKRD